MAQHKIEQKSYLSIEEAGKELILYAVGDDAVAPLKKQYIRFELEANKATRYLGWKSIFAAAPTP